MNILRTNLFKSLRLLVLVALILPCFSALAIEKPGEVLNQDVGIFTQLGSQVDLSLTFIDQSGRTGTLKDLALPGKPIIVVPVYFTCPRLCGLVLDGLLSALNKVPLKIGVDYSLLAVSFNPDDTPDKAAAKSEQFIKRYEPANGTTNAGWHFLTGSPQSITPLMSSLGFKYLKDGEDFAHSAAIMILTPTGQISQYFTGIEFSPWDVRMSLVDASQGAIGSTIDHLLLYCFRFDPLQGKYTWAVVGLLRIGGTLTLLGLAAVYLLFVRKRLRTSKS